jgi:hypothetical protein
MKPEEALKELSYDDTAYGGNCTYEVRMGAIKALKKQIPMKPNNIKSIFDFPADTIRQKVTVQFVTARDLIN